jgi:hypothetical protein
MGVLDGTAPDIFYFQQKEDGSYVFMLTSNQNGNFATNWKTDYVLVHADQAGVVQKTENMKLPSRDGITGTFDYVWDAPPATIYRSPNYSYPIPINRTTSGPSYVACMGFFTPVDELVLPKPIFNLTRRPDRRVHIRRYHPAMVSLSDF